MRCHHNLAVFACISIFGFTNVYADIGKVGGGIGKIGSPVIPSNAPKKTIDDANTDSTSDEDYTQTPEHSPLLVITFAQRRVNFERVLDQAIINNEKISPGAHYEIIATIPGTNQSAYMNAMYQNNLNSVLQEMQKLGITSERMRSSTTQKNEATAQDISIYESR